MKFVLIAMGFLVVAVSMAAIYKLSTREDEKIRVSEDSSKSTLDCYEGANGYLDYYTEAMTELVAAKDLESDVILSNVIY